MTDRVPMTPGGYKKLQEELKHIKSVDRPKNIEDIERARAHGDLSENAEYDAAKERQLQLESRMKLIEDRLARAEIIRPEDVKGDKVVFGATVDLIDLDSDRKVTYQLVGEDETDSSKGHISVKAPLARAIIGKSEGDLVVVQTPAGERQYEIEAIRFD